MIRVHIICEGQTEEMFVKEFLAPEFYAQGIFLTPSLIGRPGHKGGNFKFERLLADVKARLMSDTTAYCTTFFDFYGLPESFPGKIDACKLTGIDAKAEHLQSAITREITEKLGDEAPRRFIPYVQMYEFEGLLFSDPEKMAIGISKPELENELQKIRDAFESPECINNSVQTAPSKRITALFNGYDKPIHGSLAALEIGLTTIRSECPRFNHWIDTITSLEPL